MLSILIPVYNYDIRPFVIELVKQLEACGAEAEVRCYDDGSSGQFQNLNRELQQLERVIYKELPYNIGRSAIRNMLAREAAFPYLLFLDCDSFPEYPDFVNRYITQLQPDVLLYGGRTYEPQAPEKPEFLLRWKYGSAREVFSVAHRIEKPYHSFQTNNFVVPAKIFLMYGLNEDLRGYGHEDTQFGQVLMHQQIPVIHIDNPLRHLGLETADVFLEKTLEGVKNLDFLIKNGAEVSTVRLARFYLRLRRWGMVPAFRLYYALRKNSIRKNLLGTNPSLRSFDLYKLGELCRAGHKK